MPGKGQSIGSLAYDERALTDDDAALRLGDSAEADYRAYHDLEWGVPMRDERHLFELLILEGAQAGLSWWTILRKREGYRRAFARFDPEAVAGVRRGGQRNGCSPTRVIVRNRGKIASAIGNARATLELQAGGSSLVDHLWSFVDGRQIVNDWTDVCGRCGRKVTRRATRTGVLKLSGFVGRTVRAGDRIEIRVTQGRTGKGTYRFGAVGKYFRWPITAAGLGDRVSKCLQPGSRKPTKC